MSDREMLHLMLTVKGGNVMSWKCRADQVESVMAALWNGEVVNLTHPTNPASPGLYRRRPETIEMIETLRFRTEAFQDPSSVWLMSPSAPGHSDRGRKAKR